MDDGIMEWVHIEFPAGITVKTTRKMTLKTIGKQLCLPWAELDLMAYQRVSTVGKVLQAG